MLWRRALALVLASVTAVVLCIYALGVPATILPDQYRLLDEFYDGAMPAAVAMDVTFCVLYLAPVLAVAHARRWSVAATLAAVAATTAGLTTLACAAFRAVPPMDNPLSKWFHSAGYRTVVYDVVLMSTVFYFYTRLP